MQGNLVPLLFFRLLVGNSTAFTGSSISADASPLASSSRCRKNFCWKNPIFKVNTADQTREEARRKLLLLLLPISRFHSFLTTTTAFPNERMKEDEKKNHLHFAHVPSLSAPPPPPPPPQPEGGFKKMATPSSYSLRPHSFLHFLPVRLGH